MKSTVQVVTPEGSPKPDKEILRLVKRFVTSATVVEASMDLPIVLWHDERSDAHYTVCHISGNDLANLTDLEAVLDPAESEDYKLNRELYTDTYAYQVMRADAADGRSFEDIVVEFDESYRPKTPLKVFGGQHRVKAVEEALKVKAERSHGIRVYFGLSVEQRVDIATANNTSIAVSNDLLDRMQEELFGTELRDWAQAVGLLGADQGFTDRRDPEGRPTVRVARTFIVNFHAGLDAKKDAIPQAYVCKSGPTTDERYAKLRPTIKWNDPRLIEAGKQFAHLHSTQRHTVLEREDNSYLEFANKCTHPSVTAAWAYTAGVLQNDADALANHYGLADGAKGDPLNASALSKARLKGVDPDTYRGLGARISPSEVGRMVQVFILQATKANKRGITEKIANAAIQNYEALAAVDKAAKATARI